MAATQTIPRGGRTAPKHETAGAAVAAAGIHLVFRNIEESLRLQRESIQHRVHLWFLSVKLLRDAEDGEPDLFKLDETDPLRMRHRDMQTSVMAMGENLLCELHEHPRAVDKTTLEQVQATLDEIRMSHRMGYGGMSEHTANQILEEVFGGEK